MGAWYNRGMSKKLLQDKENQDLLNGFLHEHLPLVQRHINILKGQGYVSDQIDEGDLHMAGIRGLMEAAHRYEHELAAGDKKQQNPFGVYAATRIRGKMLDHIHGKLNEHFPKHMRTRMKNDVTRRQAETSQPSPKEETAASSAPAPKLTSEE